MNISRGASFSRMTTAPRRKTRSCSSSWSSDSLLAVGQTRRSGRAAQRNRSPQHFSFPPGRMQPFSSEFSREISRHALIEIKNHSFCAFFRRARPRLRGRRIRRKTARHGQDHHPRRQAAHGPHPDLRRQERGADADALRAAHRRAADAAQPAAARRRRQLRPSAQPAWRLDHDRGRRGKGDFGRRDDAAAPTTSPRPSRPTTSSARCAPRSWCSGRCSPAPARRRSRCPAAARSATARSTSTSRRSRRSAPRSSSPPAM